MATTKTYSISTLTPETVIKAAGAKKNGTFRSITWITDEVTVGDDRDVITITKTATVRIGLQYDHLKSVIARKAAEDEAIGAPKERRESSYLRVKTPDGKFAEPIFIVRDRKTQTRRFLQVFTTHAKHGKTIESFYKNGEFFVPDEALMEKIKETRAVRKYNPTETWVLSLNKITNIK